MMGVLDMRDWEEFKPLNSLETSDQGVPMAMGADDRASTVAGSLRHSGVSSKPYRLIPQE